MPSLHRELEMRAAGHLPSWSLERLAFEPAAAPPDASAHRDACDRCRDAVDRLLRERETFLSARPARPFVARVARRAEADRRSSRASWRTVRLWIFGGGAVAAAVMLLVAGARLAPTSKVGFKGPGTQLMVFVSRDGGAARPLERGELLHPGDVLRFGVVAPRAAHAFVASIDERRRFTRYFPQELAASVPVDGREYLQVLPGSMELDESVGREWIVLVLSEEALEQQEVAEALRHAWRTRTGDALGPVPLHGDVRVVPVTKVRP